ncbi:hypothetical protein H0H87_006784 [Tephrocybe sp. NHM501043]|nr:hypothetical protein H0H87_006784 [Tephrocybe sp. NHM501043]
MFQKFKKSKSTQPSTHSHLAAEPRSPPSDGEFGTQQTEALQKLKLSEGGKGGTTSPLGSPERRVQTLVPPVKMDSGFWEHDLQTDYEFLAATEGYEANEVFKDILPRSFYNSPDDSRRQTELILRQKYQDRFIRDQKRALTYFDPEIDDSVKFAWPLEAYAKRQQDDNQTPKLFFDISRDPTDPSLGGIRILDAEGHDMPDDFRDECLHLKFTPNIKLMMLRLKCQESLLDQWDVTIKRENGIHVIDIFREIHKTYNIRLNGAESGNLNSHLAEIETYAAYTRRAGYNPIFTEEALNRGMCRVDLVQNKTLFNGLTFNPVIGQYHFQLLEQHSRYICLSTLS